MQATSARVFALTALVAACSAADSSDETIDATNAELNTFKVRIRAGLLDAPTYTDPGGNIWSHDVDYDVGSVASNADVITGTRSPDVFHTERWASRTQYPNGFTYRIPNVPAGRYAVTLDFAETSGGGVNSAGDRQFDVLIDGTKVLTNFDIFAEAGGLDRAVFKTLTIDSKGGTLVLRFAPGAAQNPKVNAIAIDPVTVAATPGYRIERSFFGLHVLKWPAAVPFGAQRLWDSQTAWSQLEPGPGDFHFDTLHARLAAAAAAGVDVIYTFGRTPSWISSNRANTSCSGSPGECAPPSDLDGSDDAVKKFWSAFMSSVCTDRDAAGNPKQAPHKTCGPLKFFELWNEPNASNFWTGTPAQLAKMSSDAAGVIKSQCESCVVLTASVSCGGYGSRANGLSGHCDEWAADYLAAWQSRGHFADVGTWHPYPSRTNVIPAPFPETNASSSALCKAGTVPNVSCDYSVVDQIRRMRAIFDSHGLAGKPMFATEGSWGENTQRPDTEEQAAYLARWFLLQAGAGVDRAYWYAQDNTLWGTLRGPETNNPPADKDAGVNAAGAAYTQLHGWLLDTNVRPCTASGSLWSCDVTKTSGARARAIWDAAQTCTTHTSGSVVSHACTTSHRAVDPAFTHWHDLGGHSGAIVGHAVDVGARPLFLD